MRLFVVIFPLIVLGAPALAEEPRIVSVVGRSMAHVEPDTASIELGVLVRGTKLASVKDETNRRIGEVMDALKSVGLADDALRTSQMNLSLKLPRESKIREEPRFEMYRQVSVHVSDLSLLGAILEKAIEAGANQIDGIRYSTSTEMKLKERLLDEAIENAKVQAERLAKGFGARLGKVIEIQSDRGGSTSELSLVISTTADPFGGETFRPGRIKIERSVSVDFDLDD